MNNHVFASLILAALPAVSFAQAPGASAPNPSLQAACIEKIKPTLKGAERIRDIGSMAGKVEQDITFRISENSEGNKSRVVACAVQTDGSLKLVAR